ncbi:MAG TPA: hypothetical protein VH107_06255 [Lacipirellulaceae bacterium]|nr:hypothetical protein [Lacipirellulaceae bacterium]
MTVGGAGAVAAYHFLTIPGATCYVPSTQQRLRRNWFVSRGRKALLSLHR